MPQGMQLELKTRLLLRDLFFAQPYCQHIGDQSELKDIGFVDTKQSLSQTCHMKKVITFGAVWLGTVNAYACSDSDLLWSGPVLSFLAVLAGSVALFLIFSKVTTRSNVPAAKRLGFLLLILCLIIGVSLTLPAVIKVLSNKGC